ncbi:MAG: response regulator [Elusimicrobia bacterium]|nr:response regulator [Elusimicrobiota bacterium]
MNQAAILVIDDDAGWRRLLSRLFASCKYNVYCAATCAEGIRLAESRRPDCIVLDFHLTDGNASKVCSRIRSHKDIKNTPIIILSSDPDAELRAYRECRADKFIGKIEPLSKIVTSVESLLNPESAV